tara:strand:- start:862 stop:1923 length:1062 start_codon:yes stop_codon:yes gene_type:complete
MDELRLSLLVLCVVLIVGIYLRELLRRRRAAQRPAAVPAGQVSGKTPEHRPRDPLLDDEFRPSTDSYDDFAELAPEHSGRRQDDSHWSAMDVNPYAESPLAESPLAASPLDGLRKEAHGRDPVSARNDDDVPLGDLDLLSSTLEPDRARVAASVEPAPSTSDVAPKPYQQGQLDLDGLGPLTARSADTSSADSPANVMEPGEQADAPEEELIIVLHIMQPDRRNFDGRKLKGALGRAGLLFGDMNIYHHNGLSLEADRPVFSVAKAIEPGTFDELDDASYETPGLTMFMRLPSAEDGTVVLELMFAAAQSLARELDGEILDEARSTLNAQALNHLRDQVVDFNRLQRVPSATQ